MISKLSNGRFRAVVPRPDFYVMIQHEIRVLAHEIKDWACENTKSFTGNLVASANEGSPTWYADFMVYEDAFKFVLRWS